MYPDQTAPKEQPSLKDIKLELIVKLKIKRNDWLLADMCPQAANHCTLFEFETVLKFITLWPDLGPYCLQYMLLQNISRLEKQMTKVMTAGLRVRYSKTCLKRPLMKKTKMVFKTDYRLMQVKSIAECSKGSTLQYF